MLKKIISLLVIFAMLVPFSSAVAADEPTLQPTIEEILNDYHKKAFEAQMQEETGAAAYARNGSSSSKTLEQETVDTLTAAGYEAYNVTADNYSSLEATLKMDFSDLGLIPGDSYIMVINGNTSQSFAGRAVGGSDIVQNPGDWEGGSGFNYIYNGNTYTMRQVIITSGDESCLKKETICRPSELRDWTDFAGTFFEALAYFAIDKVTEPIPMGSILSMTAELLSNEEYILEEGDTTHLYASCVWTRKYLQVWNEEFSYWHTAQCSTYASAKAKVVVGLVYSNEIEDYEWVDTPLMSRIIYSDFYNNYDIRCIRAVHGLLQDTTYIDYAGDIGFSFYDNTGASITTDGTPLFTLKESISYLLPKYDYGE